MAKKTVGYVNLEWTCPSCGARNDGGRKTCPTCGAAMPEDGAFELPAEQVLDTSDDTAARVARGPDIHCPYCGTRNAGDAERCVQCRGELAGGERRQSGLVLGAHQTETAGELTCATCGRSMPASATRCPGCGSSVGAAPTMGGAPPTDGQAPPKRKLLLLLPILVGLLVVCAAGAVLLTRGTGAAAAHVSGTSWTYSIEIEALTPVTHESWRDQVPAQAALGECTPRVRHTQPEPAPRATEICSTPYVRDTGTGVGEVVQDCEYQIADDWCQYTAPEWRTVRTETTSGSEDTPVWPAIRLGVDEREGTRAERYTVHLAGDGREYTYQPRSLSDYVRFRPNTRWQVTTNALGGVTGVEPAD